MVNVGESSSREALFLVARHVQGEKTMKIPSVAMPTGGVSTGWSHCQGRCWYCMQNLCWIRYKYNGIGRIRESDLLSPVRQWTVDEVFVIIPSGATDSPDSDGWAVATAPNRPSWLVGTARNVLSECSEKIGVHVRNSCCPNGTAGGWQFWYCAIILGGSSHLVSGL